MEWDKAFEDASPSGTITVFRSRTHENIAVIHERMLPQGRLKIVYNVHGRKTDSPSRAVEIYNEEERARISGGRIPAGSPEQIKQRRAAGQVR